MATSNWLQKKENAYDPTRDPSLITLVDGSGFYDIPQSTLCKYAKKKPGEANYLWSLRHRGNRYFKKEDIERLRQSREKLKRK